MRFSVCMSVSLMMCLAGCGQSGALQLRSDPHHDGRAKYLLYSGSKVVTQQQDSKTSSNAPQQDNQP